MPDQFKNMNFSTNSLNIRDINDFLFLQDFYRHLLLSYFMNCQLHLPKSALSQCLLYVIHVVLIKYCPILFSPSIFILSIILLQKIIYKDNFTQITQRMFNNYTTEKPYESCNVILPETEQTGALLIGDFNSATDPETLYKHEIKTVITAATGLDHLEIPSFVTHITYPLTDAKSEKIHQYFDQAFQTIDQNLKHGGVLVHCAAGVSRSATLVIAYLMRKKDLSFKAAIQFVRKYRSGVCPNLGFELQLKEYEKELGNSAPPIKKNVSERLTDSVNLSQSYSSKNKKIQNYSVFSFEPVHSINSTMKKKIDPKKTVSKAFGLSKPKQKIGLGIGEAELFVAGKGAKRTASEAKHGDKKKTSKNLLMETWGISLQKGKQF